MQMAGGNQMGMGGQNNQGGNHLESSQAAQQMQIMSSNKKQVPEVPANLFHKL
jgi:hypothetical protein